MSIDRTGHPTHQPVERVAGLTEESAHQARRRRAHRTKARSYRHVVFSHVDHDPEPRAARHGEIMQRMAAAGVVPRRVNGNRGQGKGGGHGNGPDDDGHGVRQGPRRVRVRPISGYGGQSRNGSPSHGNRQGGKQSRNGAHDDRQGQGRGQQSGKGSHQGSNAGDDRQGGRKQDDNSRVLPFSRPSPLSSADNRLPHSGTAVFRQGSSAAPILPSSSIMQSVAAQWSDRPLELKGRMRAAWVDQHRLLGEQARGNAAARTTLPALALTRDALQARLRLGSQGAFYENGIADVYRDLQQRSASKPITRPVSPSTWHGQPGDTRPAAATFTVNAPSPLEGASAAAAPGCATYHALLPLLLFSGGRALPPSLLQRSLRQVSNTMSGVASRQTPERVSARLHGDEKQRE